MDKQTLFAALKGKLIVSCQALEDEPLYDPERSLMGHMALAAKRGGASGIRANTVRDIEDIRRYVDLPIIGIIKRVFKDSDVYITPTMEEVDALVAAGVDIIATDATDRPRPNGVDFESFFRACRERYQQAVFMADCSNYEEGMRASRLGFDLVGTTMASYTPYTRGRALPDVEMIGALARDAGVPVVAEGGIWTPEQLKSVFAAGAHTAVVGSAITRPMLITRRFAAVVPGAEG